MQVSTIIKHIAAATVLFSSAATFAADIDSNADANDLAIQGYDTVAYFTMGKPVLGSNEFTSNYKNATFHFVSEQNRNLFNKDKVKYAPQFGNFCAMGTAMGLKFDVDPTAWKIVEGKLYLNLNKDVQKAWLRDVPGNIQTAEQNWPELKGLTVAEARALNG
ncbi:YHS domain-containing (seleno)protein [Marinomonas sp. TI.3.20]|uniref:YHS domain-containing (seleno)protein n=1 Tax=Marinomonas sp. TI.3.20 TaxID=3121296 RepID=UPI00311E369F